jgi:hypothetical protein
MSKLSDGDCANLLLRKTSPSLTKLMFFDHTDIMTIRTLINKKATSEN